VVTIADRIIPTGFITIMACSRPIRSATLSPMAPYRAEQPVHPDQGKTLDNLVTAATGAAPCETLGMMTTAPQRRKRQMHITPVFVAYEKLPAPWRLTVDDPDGARDYCKRDTHWTAPRGAVQYAVTKIPHTHMSGLV